MGNFQTSSWEIMESIGKKLFWLINLALLTTIAFLGTRAVGTWIGADLVGIEVVGSSEPKVTTNLKADQRQPATLAEDIVKRNIFNSEPPVNSPEELQTTEDGEEEKLEEKPVPGPDDPCEATPADLKGSVTLVAEPEEWSMAVIVVGSKERLVKIGDLFEGTEVVAIQLERIVLRRAGLYECVYIEKPKKKKKGRSSVENRYSSRGKSNRKSKGIEKIRNSITKKGQGQYEVERSMLDEQLEDLTKLSRQARVIPHYVKGKTQGFKIVGVRPNSLYSALGIRSGDILKGVNGEQITSPTKALEFLEALKTTSQVTIDIERRNQKKTFEYEIK